MAVFRIEKTRDYTVMSNHHLRNTGLSLKAKGLLSLMLSLPEEWDYTTKGLAHICKDGVDSICAGVRELEEHGYVIRERVRNENGQLGAIEYTILEQPIEPSPKREKPKQENPVQVNPVLDNPVLGKPEQENPAQLNIDISSNYESKTDLSITEPSNPIPSNPPAPTGDGERTRSRIGTDGMGARETYRGYRMFGKKDDPHSRRRFPGGGGKIPFPEAGQLPRSVRDGLHEGQHHLCPQYQEISPGSALQCALHHQQLLFLPGTARYVRERTKGA